MGTLLAALVLLSVQKLPAQAKTEIFAESAVAAGLDFHHFNGMSGELYPPENMGSGIGLFDYDGDGDLDVFLAQGQMLGSRPLSAAVLPPPTERPLTGRLFRNDLEILPNGERRLRFTDVTEASAIRADGYGIGVATGDMDGDGWDDLFLANFGANQLWHNDGDGTFSDWTARAGVGDERWSVAASFVDYDQDGDQDLYAINYIDFSIANHEVCRAAWGGPDYCAPTAYQPVPDRLYRNRGDGTFENVSAVSGIAAKAGAGLGVVTADFNDDGRCDLYVANDQMPNFLWIQQADGTFREEAVTAGVAVDDAGRPEASMGVDLGDFDGDGDEDIYLTHLRRESDTLYANLGKGVFADRTLVVGLAPPTLPLTSFGTRWFDYDNDGWLDLLTVSGAVQHLEERVRAGDPYPLDQPRRLFHNRHGRFEDVTASAGAAFDQEEVGRGAAFGDLDQDGDTDVVVSNNSGPVRLFLNQVGARSPWLGFRLLDGDGEGEAIGTRVEVATGSGRRLLRRAHTDGGYASSHDSRVVVGLGEDTDISMVELTWPDGARQRLHGLQVDRYHVVRQSPPRSASAAPRTP